MFWPVDEDIDHEFILARADWKTVYAVARTPVKLAGGTAHALG
jgi:hypothetical protein